MSVKVEFSCVFFFHFSLNMSKFPRRQLPTNADFICKFHDNFDINSMFTMPGYTKRNKKIFLFDYRIDTCITGINIKDYIS